MSNPANSNGKNEAVRGSGVTLWRYDTWARPRPAIVAQEFRRVTAHFAINKDGRKQALKGYDPLFPSREEAIEYRRKQLTQSVEFKAIALNAATEELQGFNRAHPESAAIQSPSNPRASTEGPQGGPNA